MIKSEYMTEILHTADTTYVFFNNPLITTLIIKSFVKIPA